MFFSRFWDNPPCTTNVFVLNLEMDLKRGGVRRRVCVYDKEYLLSIYPCEVLCRNAGCGQGDEVESGIPPDAIYIWAILRAD